MKEDYSELIEFLDKKFNKVEKDISDFKSEMTDFKKDSLSFQDQVLTDLEMLKQEKTVGGEQDKRKTKVLEIHNSALTRKGILSSQEVAEISKLQAF